MPLLNWLFNIKSTSTIHGSADFLRGRSKRKLLSSKHDGIVINGIERISMEKSFQNCCVLGSTGMGKSSIYLIPNVLNLKNASTVITDPAGEIYRITSGYLRSIGYKIKVLNLSDVSGSLHFNPIQRCNTYTEIMKLSEILIDSAYPKDSDDAFWKNSAKSIISLLIRCVKEREAGVQNLREIYNMLNLFGADQNTINALMVEHLDDDSFKEYKAFLAQDDKVLNSVLSTAKTALSKLSDPNIAEVTRNETLHFESLRHEKTALYLIVNEWEVNYFSFILSVFYQQMFSYCMNFPSNDTSYLPIFYFLDEFGNSGKIPNFSTIISSIRKKRCHISIVLQDFEQIVNIYGKSDASVILNGGCASRIFFAGLALSTTEEVSRLLGKKTVLYKEKGATGRNNTSDLERETGRSLMNPDEIRTMPVNKLLYLYSNYPAAYLTSKPWYKNSTLIKRSKRR